MPYSAQVIHKTPGRLRLQMDDAFLSPEAMQETMVQLQSLSMSQRVRGNPLTRTILLEGESEAQLEQVLEQARENGLIQLRPHVEVQVSESLPQALSSFREKLDGFLVEISGGSLDLKSAMAWGFLGLGVRQSLQAKFLPAGMTLLFYAFGMLELDQMEKQRKVQS